MLGTDAAIPIIYSAQCESIFITTDVIEILMVGGTIKQETFILNRLVSYFYTYFNCILQSFVILETLDRVFCIVPICYSLKNLLWKIALKYAVLKQRPDQFKFNNICIYINFKRSNNFALELSSHKKLVAVKRTQLSIACDYCKYLHV